jgi:hypothetical protein
VALGLAALAFLPFGIAACGNAATKQRDDNRPEPNASTEGVRSIFPTTQPPTPQTTAQPQKSSLQSPSTGK